MPHAATLLNPNLRGYALLQALHVVDDADHLAAAVQAVQRGERNVQRGKAFVQK